MSFGEALIYSVLGMSVVFFALALLMCIIKIMTALGDRAAGKAVPVPAEASVETPAAAAPLVPLTPLVPVKAKAPGSAGELKLYNTDPRTAAMLMAIVADELKAPLNELRFISIREIKECD